MSPIASASSLPHASRIAPRFPPWVRAVRWLRRMTFLAHRWLGIALALLMALWSVPLSFVPLSLVYVFFALPRVTERWAAKGTKKR